MPDPTPPPEPLEPITRTNTVADFLKAYCHDIDGNELRLGPGTVESFIQLLTPLAIAVATKAAELSQSNPDRTTLLAKDISSAWSALVWLQGSGATASPDLLFAHINRLPTDQLADLVRRINDWLASQVHGQP